MVFFLVTCIAMVPSPFLAYGEAWCILVGLDGSRSWMATAFAVALGQTIGFGLIYVFGSQLIGRIARLRRALDTLDVERFREKAPWFLALGALTGVPPHLAMCAVAPAVGVQLGRLMALTLVMRSIRFGVLAGAPNRFSAYFGTDWLPTWLTDLI